MKRQDNYNYYDSLKDNHRLHNFREITTQVAGGCVKITGSGKMIS